MVDGGASYPAIEVTELCVLRSSLGLPRLEIYDPIQSSFAEYKYWKYGDVSHSSGERSILGSVNPTCRSDLGRPVFIRHLVIYGYSQWLICRNVTQSCNQLRIDDNSIPFPVLNGLQDYLSIVEGETHEYVLLDRFTNAPSPTCTPNSSFVALADHCVSLQASSSHRPLSEITRVVNRVHDHVCGHASYGDRRTLLKCNSIWNDNVMKMPSLIVDRCSNYLASAQPQPN